MITKMCQKPDLRKSFLNEIPTNHLLRMENVFKMRRITKPTSDLRRRMEINKFREQTRVWIGDEPKQYLTVMFLITQDKMWNRN